MTKKRVHYHVSRINCAHPRGHDIPLCGWTEAPPGRSRRLRRGESIACRIAEVTCPECLLRSARAALGDPEMPKSLVLEGAE